MPGDWGRARAGSTCMVPIAPAGSRRRYTVHAFQIEMGSLRFPLILGCTAPPVNGMVPVRVLPFVVRPRRSELVFGVLLFQPYRSSQTPSSQGLTSMFSLSEKSVPPS